MIVPPAQIASLEALELTDLDAVQVTGPDELIAFAEATLEAADGPVHALFISCGGLKTLPVVSSAIAGA